VNKNVGAEEEEVFVKPSNQISCHVSRDYRMKETQKDEENVGHDNDQEMMRKELLLRRLGSLDPLPPTITPKDRGESYHSLSKLYLSFRLQLNKTFVYFFEFTRKSERIVLKILQGRLSQKEETISNIGFSRSILVLKLDNHARISDDKGCNNAQITQCHEFRSIVP
jgi:hypothetical protein